jgi:FtsP/CotA-like multicopper oxidase with cupredoxin domain
MLKFSFYMLSVLFLFNNNLFAKDVYYNLQITSFVKNIDSKKIKRYQINGEEFAPIIRANKGDILHISVENKTDIPTIIHWHGVILPNEMDGVIGANAVAIEPNKKFIYNFKVSQIGTYWYHAHGLEEALGIYGGIIFNDNNKIEEGNLLLYSGILEEDPSVVFDKLNPMAKNNHNSGMKHMKHNSETQDNSVKHMKHNSETQDNSVKHMKHNSETQDNSVKHMKHNSETQDNSVKHMKHNSETMPKHYSDVSYVAHTINSQTLDYLIDSKNQTQVKLRIVNSYVDGYLNFVYSGGKIKVVATDGVDIKPVEVDNLKIAMGETYDVILNINSQNNIYELVAFFMGSAEYSKTLVGNMQSKENLIKLPSYKYDAYSIASNYDNFVSINKDAINFDKYKDVKSYDLKLAGKHHMYNWSIEWKQEKLSLLSVKQGDKVIIKLKNDTEMDHPMHLHGSFFMLKRKQGDLIKHTINIEPKEEIEIEFVADAYGKWLFHCHNLFHMSSGMTITFDVQK